MRKVLLPMLRQVASRASPRLLVAILGALLLNVVDLGVICDAIFIVFSVAKIDWKEGLKVFAGELDRFAALFV